MPRAVSLARNASRTAFDAPAGVQAWVSNSSGVGPGSSPWVSLRAGSGIW